MCVHSTWPSPLLAGVICAKLEAARMCSVWVRMCEPIPLCLEDRQNRKHENYTGCKAESSEHSCRLTFHLLD